MAHHYHPMRIALGYFCRSSAYVVVLLLGLMSTNLWAGSATYSYDSLGRLTRVEYSSGVVIEYTYDAAGNRSSHVVSGAPN